MASKWSIAAIGLGAFLSFLLISFPASVAYRWFAPDAVRLAAIEGTVWRGSAGLGAIEGLAVSDLRWQLHPSALLRGRLSATAEGRFRDGFGTATVIASSDRVVIRNLRASARLQSLREVLPIAATEGQLSATLTELTLVDGWPIGAVGEVRITGLRVAPLFGPEGANLIELGDYSARLTSSETPGIVAALSDQGGPIELAGRASLLPDRTYRIEGLVRARPGAPSELVQGLELMSGPPNANGQRELTPLTGRL
ncbi:MAG: type II secretion system protein N [Gammaproteobacteria bacterium]|nr:type II secretion system protein N [Gammaproteobacteria bacterium]